MSTRPSSPIQWSAYPALLLAGCFAAGIVLAGTTGFPAVGLWWGGIGGGVALFGATEWWDRRRLVTLAPLGRAVAAGLVVACAGGLCATVYRAPSPQALAPVAAAVPDGEAAVIGVIDGPPERSKSETRLTLAVDTAFITGDTARVTGKARVTLQPSPWTEQTAPFPRVHEGDRVRLEGFLQPAPGKRNPGGFDYAAYLARRGVCCTMYVSDPAAVRVLGRDRGVLTDLLVSGREYLRSRIRRYVPSDGGRAVLLALLLGDRSRITDQQRRHFARTGLMHLLAVSGLHVFLVGMVLYGLLRPLLLRFRLPRGTVEVGRAGLTVAVLGLYLGLTGTQPSVVRAVVMSTLLIGGVLIQRPVRPLNTLGVAALVLLAARPPALYDAGFQLSMGAVAGIVTLQPRLRAPVPEAWLRPAGAEWLTSMIIVSAAAVLGTAPILLFHFGWVSVAGLLLNVAGIPCTGLALAAAIAMATVGSVAGIVAAGFGSAADLFARALLFTSEQGAAWLSWAGVRVVEPGPMVLGVLALGIAAVAQWPRPRVRWRCVVGGLALATMSVWGTALGTEPTLDVIFFDVGNGDAALVSTPAGEHVLVDTGPRSPGGSAAAYSVVPYLRTRGIHHLDAVVVTHPDEDHLGGLPAVLRAVSVGKVVWTGRTADTELYREAWRRLKQQAVATREVRRGDHLSGTQVRGQVLGPPDPQAFSSVNNASVVLHLTYGRTEILLSGDIEEEAERRLVGAYGDQLRSQLVKVPHHGSETSSSGPFVEAATDSSETHAVVSVGEGNQFGMPHSSVLSMWKEHGAQIHQTSESGAVWMRTDGREVWRLHWK